MQYPPAVVARAGVDRRLWIGVIAAAWLGVMFTVLVRAAPGALRQVFPGADVATLVARHREAVAWLATQGVRTRRLQGTEFQNLLRLAAERQRTAFHAARLSYALTAIWRTISKTTPE